MLGTTEMSAFFAAAERGLKVGPSAFKPGCPRRDQRAVATRRSLAQLVNCISGLIAEQDDTTCCHPYSSRSLVPKLDVEHSYFINIIHHAAAYVFA